MDTRPILFNTAEYQASLALRARILRHPLGKELSSADVCGEEAQWHIGCFDGRHLVGCVVAKPLPGGKGAKLRQMAVDPQYQGQGIGRQLLQYVEQFLGAQGITDLELSARQTAIGFYEKLGFFVEGELYLEQGIEHIKMRK